MKAGAIPRWAVSFADLGLLLIGCFVMLHAIEASRPKADAGPVAPPAFRARGEESYHAAELFEAGDARLTAPARARLQAAGRHWIGQPIRVVSYGAAEGSARLDRFELAAARSAAVARALREGGVREGDVEIRVEGAAATAQDQVIEVVRR